MIGQLPDTGQSLVKQIRAHLSSAATHEPAEMQPVISLLDRQILNFGNENEDGKAALRPVNLDNLKRFERARGCGR